MDTKQQQQLSPQAQFISLIRYREEGVDETLTGKPLLTKVAA